MKITKILTNYNYDKGVVNKRDYIAIHYVGSVSSAKGNCLYFQGGNRNAGCHYFVDKTGVYQSQTDDKVAWHVGANEYTKNCNVQSAEKRGLKNPASLYSKVSNHNAIGIEMCLIKKNGKLYVDKKTVKNTGKLVRYLMKKYEIPYENVIRHYDVTGKACPDCSTWLGGNLLYDANWKIFKRKITSRMVYKTKKKVNAYNKPNGDKVDEYKAGKKLTAMKLNKTRRWVKVAPDTWVRRKELKRVK